MKMLPRLLTSFFVLITISFCNAATTFTLNSLGNFGSGASPYRGDGSIQPGDSLGINPITGNNIIISAPNINFYQPGESTYDARGVNSCTNGFDMRGITYDPTSGNVIFCDTHSGSG